MELGNLHLITLSAAGYEAVVSLEWGGALISLKKNGVEALNVPESEEALASSTTSYGFPLLFPPNRIDGGTFTAAGKTYHFPINEPARNNSLHGFLHKQTWQVESQSESALTLVFKADKNTNFYEYLPVEFEARRILVLSEDGMKETVEIKNKDTFTMPIGLGFHTAFAVDETSKALVSVGERIITSDRMLPQGVRELNQEEKAFREGGMSPVAWSMDNHYTVEALEIEGKKFHGVILESDSAKVTYEVDPFYRHWVIWNKQMNGKFFCIEPQNWCINAPNLVDTIGEKAGMDLLGAGETLSAWTSLKIENK